MGSLDGGPVNAVLSGKTAFNFERRSLLINEGTQEIHVRSLKPRVHDFSRDHKHPLNN